MVLHIYYYKNNNPLIKRMRGNEDINSSTNKITRMENIIQDVKESDISKSGYYPQT